MILCADNVIKNLEMEEQNEVEVLHLLNLSYISRIDESNRLLRSLSNHYALLASKRAEIHKIEVCYDNLKL